MIIITIYEFNLILFLYNFPNELFIITLKPFTLLLVIHILIYIFRSLNGSTSKNANGN